MDPALRSAIARAVGLASEALYRAPESPLTAAWARALGVPAMTALRKVAEALDATPPAQPAPTVLVVGPGQASPLPATPTRVLKLVCSRPGGCVTTAFWNPLGGHHGRYEPKRPSLPVIRQVATALITDLGRALTPTELTLGLRAATTCSTRTAHRAIRGAVLAGALAADAANRITVPVRRAPAGEAADWAEGDTLVAVRPEEHA